MTTYNLRDAYIYDSQEIPRPKMLPIGEIILNDGTTALIPQPVKWKSTSVGDTTYITSDGMRNDGLTWTGVMDAFAEAPQTHAEARSARPPVPVWPVALILLGLVLMAFGWLLNEPISLLIYTAIHGS